MLHSTDVMMSKGVRGRNVCQIVVLATGQLQLSITEEDMSGIANVDFKVR